MKMMVLLFIFFSKEKIKKLSNGFENIDIENFEEGSFPRKLFFVQNKKIY